MKKGYVCCICMVMVMTLLLTGCGKNSRSSSVAYSQDSSSKKEVSIPGSYNIPDGWVKSEKYSTASQIFYTEKGHENDEHPDNIAISVGKNKYSLEDHVQFREAVVQQLLKQMDGNDAQLNGDGTYTKQGDRLYIFTIDEGDVVTTQYYILKEYGFCLVHLTNFSGSDSAEKAAGQMVDSFVWDSED